MWFTSDKGFVEYSGKKSFTWRTYEDGSLVFEVEKNNIQTVISELFKKFDVKDLYVEDIPLKESLELLYR